VNREILIQRLVKAGVVDSPPDDRLRKRQFDGDEWANMPELLKEWFMLVAPRQVDEVLAEIAKEKKSEADADTKRKQTVHVHC
jgi:hypothetical protein